eukprot:TRINITY_DN1315_c0_g2_i2.p1 TRINITY_DN1315_c0_g2~~TRINITY_DN1315_c0_g2_i2.p1  ORF type:complete len:209 (-),score=24.80 TRINITY_DN1315_c0_g2_i2:89-715(-)
MGRRSSGGRSVGGSTGRTGAPPPPSHSAAAPPARPSAPMHAPSSVAPSSSAAAAPRAMPSHTPTNPAVPPRPSVPAAAPPSASVPSGPINPAASVPAVPAQSGFSGRSFMADVASTAAGSFIGNSLSRAMFGGSSYSEAPQQVQADAPIVEQSSAQAGSTTSAYSYFGRPACSQYEQAFLKCVNEVNDVNECQWVLQSLKDCAMRYSN